MDELGILGVVCGTKKKFAEIMLAYPQVVARASKIVAPSLVCCLSVPQAEHLSLACCWALAQETVFPKKS